MTSKYHRCSRHGANGDGCGVYVVCVIYAYCVSVVCVFLYVVCMVDAWCACVYVCGVCECVMEVFLYTAKVCCFHWFNKELMANSYGGRG